MCNVICEETENVRCTVDAAGHVRPIELFYLSLLQGTIARPSAESK